MPLNNQFRVKNDLNTLGRILSGGTDISSIFSPSNTSWTLSANNGTFGVAGGDTLSVQGGNGVDVRVATGTDTVRISGIDATTSVKGVASFNNVSFAVTNGDVTIKTGGVSNVQLAGSITDDKLSTITTAGKVANSATTATSTNTANAIVARGASGEFSSGSITATGNLSASGTVTGNAVVASDITATNLLSAASTFTRQLSVGEVQVRTVGTSNVFLGNSTTGRDATTGNHNLVFGLSAGNALTTGSSNVFVGNNAGRVNDFGSSNNFLGQNAGFSNITGGSNNFLGYNAGRCNTTGFSNNFLGFHAGCANTTGFSNNFLGPNAGRYNTTGNSNNFFGVNAGCVNTIGSNNNIIGNQANVATNSLSGVIVLGTGAVATESHQIVLSTANVVFKNTGSTFEIGTPSLTDNLTVFGAVSSTGIVNTNTGFRISNAATSGHVLRGNGTNFVASTLSASDIVSGRALTAGNDTNVTLTLSGAASVALLSAASITAGWSGQLSQARGGTGNTTGQAASVANSVTFNNSGAGASSPTSFDGSATRTISFNTIGASPLAGSTSLITTGTVTTGTWGAALAATSGTINNTTIGGVTPAAGTFTALSASGTFSANTLNQNVNIGAATGTGVTTINSGSLGTMDDIAIGETVRASGKFTTLDANGNVTLSPTGSVTINPTVASNINNVAIGASTPSTGRFTTLEATGNLTVGGNLTVAGSAAYVNTNNLIVKDPIIFLAEGNLTDAVDIGFTGAYNHGSVPPRHTGLVRDFGDKKWTLFSNLSAEVLSATNINFNDPSVVIDTLKANIEGTLTGNVSGAATQATRFVTGRTISTTGDVNYTSPSFDGSANVSAAATIANNAVTYAKFQQVAANSVVGNPTGSTANAVAIPTSVTGLALLSATSAATGATTLGLGVTNSVTHNDITLGGSSPKVNNAVYTGSVTSGSTLTVQTFSKTTYSTGRYTVQIRNTTTNARAALDIIATNNGALTSWDGSVFGIIDTSNIFTNVDVDTTGATVGLAFTFNGTANYAVTILSTAIAD